VIRREPKTTSSTLGPDGGFWACFRAGAGFRDGVVGALVMEATSGVIGGGDVGKEGGRVEVWNWAA
jgi:hypothetical protein